MSTGTGRATAQRDQSPSTAGGLKPDHRPPGPGVGQHGLSQRLGMRQFISKIRAHTANTVGTASELSSPETDRHPSALDQPSDLMTTLAAESEKTRQHELHPTAGRKAPCGQPMQPLKRDLMRFGWVNAAQLYDCFVGV